MGVTATGSLELDMERRDMRPGLGEEEPGVWLAGIPADVAPANEMPGRVYGSWYGCIAVAGAGREGGFGKMLRGAVGGCGPAGLGALATGEIRWV